MKSIHKFKRLSQVLTVLYKYGFDDFIARTKLDKYLSPNTAIDSEKKEADFYTRIKLVIEELGPTYIKLGQMLSNRDDLLPPEMIMEFKQLQDNVAHEDLNIHEKLESELGINITEMFKYINPIPLASASVSQVYKAQLINDEWVVLKIKREGIESIIKSDILIMKDIAKLLEKHYQSAKKMNLTLIVNSFENNMARELSFLNEYSNIERFRANFKNETAIYVPKTYRDLSNNNILCMEFVEGIKITDINALKSNEIDPVEINNIGLDLYLRQVIDHGFFHADPHPGNIFILKNKQICFIDFGSMGTIMPYEREALEEIIINFVFKDANRVIAALKKLAILYDIPNEKALEKDIYGVFEILDGPTIENINATDIINKMKIIMNKNHFVFPEFVYLLARGIIIIEGIGKQINPDMNITTAAKPYVNKYLQQRYNLKKIVKDNLKNIRNIYETLQSLPNSLSLILENVRDNKFSVNNNIIGLKSFEKTLQRIGSNLVLALLILGFSIGSSIIYTVQAAPFIFGIPSLAFLGFLFSAILCLVLAISILKK